KTDLDCGDGNGHRERIGHGQSYPTWADGTLARGRQSGLECLVPGGDMRIAEIYQSIQGESSFAGLPCVFVRTTGCDLRCSWCDSEFTFTGGSTMTLDQIIAEVEKYNCKLV